MERSGVQRNEKGELVIPGSRRPDGTYRKPIKVKEGYIPPEEAVVYEPEKAKGLKDRPNIPGLRQGDSSEKPLSKSAKKNLKRKEKKQGLDEEPMSVSAPSGSGATSGSSRGQTVAGGGGALADVTERRSEAEAELSKQLKNLRKKLKQIEVIQQKIASGALTNPEPDQLKKIERKEEYTDEVEDLIFRLESM